jgi:hypothetical protein
MSEHRSHHAAAAVAVLPFVFAVLSAPEASARLWEPDAGSQTSPVVPFDWPDEGTGYPGYADPLSPIGTVSNQRSALDVTSIALGALGGIALGGAGLGITLAVQRRRDHALPGESA